MARFISGQIVVVPFPFSNLSSSKRRPALVLVDLPGDDIILCQITSKKIRDHHAIRLYQSDIEKGQLAQESNIRPTRLFTADKNIIVKVVGEVNKEKLKDVRESIKQLIDPQERISVSNP